MKKLLVILIILLNISFIAKADEIDINNHKFVSIEGYLYIDLSTYKYNKFLDKYSMNVIETIDPGGDMENIKCPYGNGFVSHLVYSFDYWHKKKYYNTKYKGFVCAEDVVEYENDTPIYHSYKYIDIFYDNNTKLVQPINTKSEYLSDMTNMINGPYNEYNFFTFIQNLKTLKH